MNFFFGKGKQDLLTMISISILPSGMLLSSGRVQQVALWASVIFSIPDAMFVTFRLHPTRPSSSEDESKMQTKTLKDNYIFTKTEIVDVAPEIKIKSHI